jgi:hypothetical protein
MHEKVVDEGALSLSGPQDPPDTLDVLAPLVAARDHDPDVGIGKVDALVQDLRRDESAQGSGTESFEDRDPLFALMSRVRGMIRNSRATR